MGNNIGGCCNPTTVGSAAELQISPVSGLALSTPSGIEPANELKEIDSQLLQTLEKASKYRKERVKESEHLWIIHVKDHDGKMKEVYCRGDIEDSEMGAEVTLFFPKGQIFEGKVMNQRPVEGAFVFRKGCYYTGNIVDYNAEGFGRYQDESTGYIYEGTWSKSLPHGKGLAYYQNGDVFEGQFMYGQKFGQGVYHFADGKKYEGTFYLNQSDGTGTMTYPNKESYRGEWKLGKYHGSGKFLWSSGDIYEGQYENGLRNGRGKYSFNNGSYYEGDWKDGLQSGWGIFHEGYDDVEGEWFEGELMS